MKKLLRFLLPILLLSSCMEQEEENLEARLAHFYAWYLTMSAERGSKDLPNDTLSRYCTETFLARMRDDTDLDYDMITSSPDISAEWAKTVTVAKATQKRDKIFRVSWLTDAKEHKSHNIVVTMGKEGGLWKIDYVQDNE